MNNIIKNIMILSISLIFLGCVDDQPELKSFYKMSCDELMTKQAQLKVDIGSNSFGIILEDIFNDHNMHNESQREDNNLKRDLRDVQRAIYDRKCEWENTK